jgi:hypothetical protein
VGRLGLHELDIDSDGDLVSNEDSAGLEGSVPGRAEVLRLIFVFAEIATQVLPHGSFVGGVGPSTAKTRCDLSFHFTDPDHGVVTFTVSKADFTIKCGFVKRLPKLLFQSSLS